jgi:hypothetical protein
VALAWQFMFLVISRDPERYRMAMIPAVIEKFGFGIAVIVLFLLHRVVVAVLAAGLVDLALGVLFIEAYRRTSPRVD